VIQEYVKGVQKAAILMIGLGAVVLATYVSYLNSHESQKRQRYQRRVQSEGALLVEAISNQKEWLTSISLSHWEMWLSSIDTFALARSSNVPMDREILDLGYFLHSARAEHAQRFDFPPYCTRGLVDSTSRSLGEGDILWRDFAFAWTLNIFSRTLKRSSNGDSLTMPYLSSRYSRAFLEFYHGLRQSCMSGTNMCGRQASSVIACLVCSTPTQR